MFPFRAWRVRLWRWIGTGTGKRLGRVARRSSPAERHGGRSLQCALWSLTGSVAPDMVRRTGFLIGGGMMCSSCPHPADSVGTAQDHGVFAMEMSHRLVLAVVVVVMCAASAAAQNSSASKKVVFVAGKPSHAFG